jgi:hypothetical protein
MRAAEAYIWAEVILRLVAGLVLAGVVVGVWTVLKMAAHVMG